MPTPVDRVARCDQSASDTPVPPVEIRRWTAGDDMLALTQLIHQAYAPLAARGLRYWGSHQTVEDTAKRCARGETWLALVGTDYVGTVTLSPPETPGGSPWLDRRDVAKFNQLCVHPTLQGSGLGSRLLDLVERRAAELGAAHVACDTSEDAHALIQLYHRRGYVFVENLDWPPRTNYRSVVLSLPLRSPEPTR